MNDFLEFLCFLNLNINFLNENKLRKIEIVYILFLRVNWQRVRLPMFSIRKRSVLIRILNLPPIS